MDQHESSSSVDNITKRIQTLWEVPYVVHFCQLFRDQFSPSHRKEDPRWLPRFHVEDFERAIALSTNPALGSDDSDDDTSNIKGAAENDNDGGSGAHKSKKPKTKSKSTSSTNRTPKSSRSKRAVKPRPPGSRRSSRLAQADLTDVTGSDGQDEGSHKSSCPNEKQYQDNEDVMQDNDTVDMDSTGDHSKEDIQKKLLTERKAQEQASIVYKQQDESIHERKKQSDADEREKGKDTHATGSILDRGETSVHTVNQNTDAKDETSNGRTRTLAELAGETFRDPDTHRFFDFGYVDPLLIDLHVKLLRGLLDNDAIDTNSWEMVFSDVISDNLPFFVNPFNKRNYRAISPRKKVILLYYLCEWRLDAPDTQSGEPVHTRMKDLVPDSLRFEPLGRDTKGCSYWYFAGMRLYRERPSTQSPSSSLTPRRGRGRPPSRRDKIRIPNSIDVLLKPQRLDDRDHRIAQYGEWELVCQNSEDWEALTKSLACKGKTEAAELYRQLKDDFVPEIKQMWEREQNQRKRREKLQLLASAPRRLSRRQLAMREQQERQARLEEERRQRLEEERRNREEAAARRREEARLQREREYESTRQRLCEEAEKRRANLPNVDLSWYPDANRVYQQVTSHEEAWPFREPVTDDEAPLYSEIIKYPMDLEKIEQHLQDKLYDDLDEFCADMLLMFENCRTYNAPDTIFYDAANRLQEYFRRRMVRTFRGWDSSAAEVLNIPRKSESMHQPSETVENKNHLPTKGNNDNYSANEPRDSEDNDESMEASDDDEEYDESEDGDDSDDVDKVSFSRRRSNQTKRRKNSPNTSEQQPSTNRLPQQGTQQSQQQFQLSFAHQQLKLLQKLQLQQTQPALNSSPQISSQLQALQTLLLVRPDLAETLRKNPTALVPLLTEMPQRIGVQSQQGQQGQQHGTHYPHQQQLQTLTSPQALACNTVVHNQNKINIVQQADPPSTNIGHSIVSDQQAASSSVHALLQHQLLIAQLQQKQQQQQTPSSSNVNQTQDLSISSSVQQNVSSSSLPVSAAMVHPMIHPPVLHTDKILENRFSAPKTHLSNASAPQVSVTSNPLTLTAVSAFVHPTPTPSKPGPSIPQSQISSLGLQRSTPYSMGPPTQPFPFQLQPICSSQANTASSSISYTISQGDYLGTAHQQTQKGHPGADTQLQPTSQVQQFPPQLLNLLQQQLQHQRQQQNPSGN